MMKQRLIAVVLTFCLFAVLILPQVKAADPVYFSAINDDILPLKAETMPKYIGDTLYLPFTTFASKPLGIYLAVASDQSRVMLYTSNSSNIKQLLFDVTNGMAFDQERQQYNYVAHTVNGTVYLPALKVCEFFNLKLTVIDTSPAPIVRIKTSSAVLNDQTLPYYSPNRSAILKYYNDYIGDGTVTTTPATSPTPTGQNENTYEHVTIYLSFNKLSGGLLKNTLNIVDSAGYKCSFFVAADEIAENADLLRRVVGEGHTLGIWLKNGTYDDYAQASSLLFEATKIRTFLVSAPQAVESAAEKMANEKSLIYWHVSRRYEDAKAPSLSAITSKLSVLDGSRESLSFSCTDSSQRVITSLLKYLKDKHYTVRRITETSIPTYSIS